MDNRKKIEESDEMEVVKRKVAIILQARLVSYLHSILPFERLTRNVRINPYHFQKRGMRGANILSPLMDNRKKIEESDEMEVKKRKLFGAENEKNLEVKFSFSDVKNKYKDANLPPNWKAFNTIIFNEREEGLHDTGKIAAFDFDGCLANTSVKRIGADAWSLMYPSIPEKLQELYNGGHKLVIFTNESNIERWKNKRQQAVNSKIGRLDSFIKLVKVPIQVFIACGLGNSKMEIDDPFRKPKTGMWKIFTEHFNSGEALDMNQSFYVGDAAGRAKDHSDADIKFAQAIGLKFYVPEKIFLA